MTFNQHDTRLTLSVDSERVRAKDSRGHVAFDFQMRELRDVRLTREWSQPLALDDPTALIESISSQEDAYGVAMYLGIGAVLAQVRIPWHSLELAWNKDGVIKTVALEVPGHGSRQLVRDLLNAAAAAQ